MTSVSRTFTNAIYADRRRLAKTAEARYAIPERPSVNRSSFANRTKARYAIVGGFPTRRRRFADGTGWNLILGRKYPVVFLARAFGERGSQTFRLQAVQFGF
jgi:hypothetical protein